MHLRYKLPLAFAAGTLVLAGVVALVAALVLRGEYLDRQEDNMLLQMRQFAAVLGQGASSFADEPDVGVQALTDRAGDAGDLRFTLIASDGTVLADSEVDPADLDNHADRPEIAQALAGNEGRVRRRSSTLDQLEVYVAIPLPESEAAWSQGVLRAALPASRVDAMLAASWQVPLLVWAILLVPTLVISYYLTRSITLRLARLRDMTARVASGDLSHRTGVHTSDELGELANSLNAMTAELEGRVDQLATEEERSKQVLSAMSDGVIVVDDDDRFVRANPAAGRILGVPLEGLEGSPLVHVVRAFPARRLGQKARRAGRPITEVLQLPGLRYLAVEVIPLSTSGPQPGHTLFVISDETARLATDRMRRDFATNVSHELKTPLASLSLLAETLKHAVREDPRQAEAFVGQLSAEIARLTELTNDLLMLSQLEEPGVAPEAGFTKTDLGCIALETIAELRSQAEAKNQELAADIATPAFVSGDEVTLRTLMRNLLDNAIRYTEPAGHIAVAVRKELLPQANTAGRTRRELGHPEQTWVVLTVTDDGAGIPLREQQRIFERFYRVDKARSRETGGTGLGLSIVRHVAERHGGRVEVASTVGSGSTFTVWIPAA